MLKVCWCDVIDNFIKCFREAVFTVRVKYVSKSIDLTCWT